MIMPPDLEVRYSTRIRAVAQRNVHLYSSPQLRNQKKNNLDLTSRFYPPTWPTISNLCFPTPLRPFKYRNKEKSAWKNMTSSTGQGPLAQRQRVRFQIIERLWRCQSISSPLLDWLRLNIERLSVQIGCGSIPPRLIFLDFLRLSEGHSSGC